MNTSITYLTNTANTAYTEIIFKPDYFRAYIDYTDRKEKTVKLYLTCIKQFAQYLQLHNIATPTRQTVKEYKAYLDTTPLKAATKAQYLGAVKQFFKWTAAEGIYPNISENIHGPKLQKGAHSKKALTPEQTQRVAQSIDRSTEEGKRLYAMFLLCTVNGLRTIELNRADIADIETIDGHHFIKLQGKGHDEKDQTQELIQPVYMAIHEYLHSRTDSPTKQSPLFVSTSNRSEGQRIAVTTISAILKTMLVNAGYDSDQYTAHSLRHTAGTAAHNAGLTLFENQQLMRHSDPSTTEIYIHDENRAQTESKGRTAIYNHLFGNGQTQPETAAALIEEIQTMTPEQQKQLLTIIKEMKG